MLVQLLHAQNLNKPSKDEVAFHPLSLFQLIIHSPLSSTKLLTIPVPHQGNWTVNQESFILSFCPWPSPLPPYPCLLLLNKGKRSFCRSRNRHVILASSIESKNFNSSCLGYRQLVWCRKIPEILLSSVPGFVCREELILVRNTSEHELPNSSLWYRLPDNWIQHILEGEREVIAKNSVTASKKKTKQTRVISQ